MSDPKPETSGRILVVDDYAANVRLLERNLQASGYATLAAYDGEETLEKVRTERPDLILLDVMLPKIDGFEVCRRLRADETTAVIPIIMITALKETEDRIRGLEAGADDFISKPFDRGELLARVKSLLQIKYYRTMLAEREKFDAVIQDLSHGIVVTDGDWNIQVASRRAAELLGFDGEDLTGRRLEDVLDKLRVDPSMEALRQSRARAVTVELTREEPPAPPVYLAGRYTRIEGPQGGLYSGALVFRDITEMRRREHLKRDFLRLISHKLKTPLTTVVGFLEMIEGGKYGEVPPEMTRPLRSVSTSVRNLADVIEKILTYASLTATELERAGGDADVGAVLGRVRERLEHRYPGREVRYDFRIPGDLPRARIREELLSIVLDNLMDNAVKFNTAEAPCAEVWAELTDNQWLWVHVRDNGPGIPASEREEIFADFSQVEEGPFVGNIAGIGLGLSTARRIVETWHGTLEVDSAVGEGSTFSFTMPSEHAPAGE